MSLLKSPPARRTPGEAGAQVKSSRSETLPFKQALELLSRGAPDIVLTTPPLAEEPESPAVSLPEPNPVLTQPVVAPPAETAREPEAAEAVIANSVKRGCDAKNDRSKASSFAKSKSLVSIALASHALSMIRTADSVSPISAGAVAPVTTAFIVYGLDAAGQALEDGFDLDRLPHRALKQFLHASA